MTAELDSHTPSKVSINVQSLLASNYTAEEIHKAPMVDGPNLALIWAGGGEGNVLEPARQPSGDATRRRSDFIVVTHGRRSFSLWDVSASVRRADL